MSGSINPYEGVLLEGSHIDGGCGKNWCARQCASVFWRHIAAIARDLGNRLQILAVCKSHP